MQNLSNFNAIVWLAYRIDCIPMQKEEKWWTTKKYAQTQLEHMPKSTAFPNISWMQLLFMYSGESCNYIQTNIKLTRL